MKLLIVEDENEIRDGLASINEWSVIGITQVCTASNVENGWNKAMRFRPDIIITDIRMPRFNGIDMAKKIVEIDPMCQIIFFSAYSELGYYKAALELKAVSYVEKPIEEACLISAVKRGIEERKKLMNLEQLEEISKQTKLYLIGTEK